MTSESEERMISDCVDSPSIEEVSSEGNLFGGGSLKKGPWTSAEDAILVDYVNKHGEGNWNAVQKHSGLSRCGKSCRLRWANHLRPDLKKGAFTSEEERRIIELHAKMGNKWARMAAELPGRTDNEIKNYWNTRIKRRQRAGLPIYPPDICLQALNENHQSQSTGSFQSGDTGHPGLLPTDNLKLPVVEFLNLELNQQLYPSNLLDIPSSSLLAQGLGSSHQSSFMLSMLHPNKRLRESEPLIPGVNDIIPAFEQYPDEDDHDDGEKIDQSFGFSSFSCNPDLNPNLSSSSSIVPGSHALINGNSSSSEPISWAMKLELPSLQYSDPQAGSWGSPSPLPSLESVDTLFLCRPTEQPQSDCLSPRSSGLLESVLYEAETLKNSKNNLCHPTSNATVMPGDMMDGSSENLWQTEWEACGDPISPLGNSISSVFSEYTPVSGSSSDEPQLVENVSDKQGLIDWVATPCDDGKEETAHKKIFSRPDLLLGTNWFGNDSERGKENSILTDAIGALVGEDFRKQTSTICSRGSCTWDNMSEDQ